MRLLELRYKVFLTIMSRQPHPLDTFEVSKLDLEKMIDDAKEAYHSLSQQNEEDLRNKKNNLDVPTQLNRKKRKRLVELENLFEEYEWRKDQRNKIKLLVDSFDSLRNMYCSPQGEANTLNNPFILGSSLLNDSPSCGYGWTDEQLDENNNLMKTTK